MHAAREDPRRNRLDRLAKEVATSGLASTGRVETEAEVVADAQRADVWYEPDPARDEERSRLGLLGRMAMTACTIEAFSDTPSVEDVRACVHKHLSGWRSRGRTLQGADPFLWVLSTGRPVTALAELWMRPMPGWPLGIYAAAPLLRVVLIVQAELPRDRTTLLVRLMSGGRVLQEAIRDLKALPAGAPERGIAFPALLRSRAEIADHPPKSAEEEEFVMSTRDIVEEIRAEGRAEGRTEGEARGEARGEAKGLHAAVETACEILGIDLTPERRAAIDGLDATGLTALLGRLRSERQWG